MENLRLDNTQNRNLTFIKFFGLGLLILALLQIFLTEKHQAFTENLEKDLPAKVCKTQKENQNSKKNI